MAGKNHGVHEGRMLFAAIVLCKVRTNIFNDVEIYDVSDLIYTYTE